MRKLLELKSCRYMAIQWKGRNCIECLDFMGASTDILCNPDLHTTDTPVVHTQLGTEVPELTDWIVKFGNDDFRVIKDAEMREKFNIVGQVEEVIA